MSTIYQEIILDHFHAPHNFGELDGATNSAAVSNSSCGDKFTIQLFVKAGIVKDARFSGDGCAISIASASMLTDFVKGKKVGVVAKLKAEDLLKLLNIELSPTRLRCALLPLEGISRALQTNSVL